MASPTRPRASEDERRHRIRTLTIATISSATAAVVISQFSVAGTWIAAAVTPVLVTLIGELLQKPTTVIASRMTTDRPAVITERAPVDPDSGEEPPVRVYRSGGGGRSAPRVRRRVAVGLIAATATVAFAITAVALTGTELITGGSIGKGSSRTTLWGGSKHTSTTQENQTTTPAQQNTDQQQQQTTPDNGQQKTTPHDEQQTTPQQTSPSTTTPVAPPTLTTP